jgi:heme exporter protein B
LFRDALLVAGKDLRIEARSRVALNQVAPLALLILLLFAFALDPGPAGGRTDESLLTLATPGLFWVAVLFSGIMAIQRAFTLEAADGNRDGLRLSGLDPAGVFLGKFAAVAVQLLALEVVLLAGVALFYRARLDGLPLLGLTCVVATAGMAAAGTLYGVLAAGLRVRDTLLPLLLLPVLAPVLIGSTRTFEAAIDGRIADAWPWLGLLTIFALVYIGFGAASFGPLLEES